MRKEFLKSLILTGQIESKDGQRKVALNMLDQLM